jgi:DNA-binding HxlR family transcriptional regulator
MNTMQVSVNPSAIFIGKWTPRVLFLLKERPYRHGELRRHLDGISQRMLTKTLRSLESTGLVGRRVTKTKTISAEYSLTKPGTSIIAPLKGMCRWAKRYAKAVSADVQLAAPPTTAR